MIEISHDKELETQLYDMAVEYGIQNFLMTVINVIT